MDLLGLLLWAAVFVFGCCMFLLLFLTRLARPAPPIMASMVGMARRGMPLGWADEPTLRYHAKQQACRAGVAQMSDDTLRCDNPISAPGRAVSGCGPSPLVLQTWREMGAADSEGGNDQTTGLDLG